MVAIRVETFCLTLQCLQRSSLNGNASCNKTPYWINGCEKHNNRVPAVILKFVPCLLKLSSVISTSMIHSLNVIFLDSLQFNFIIFQYSLKYKPKIMSWNIGPTPARNLLALKLFFCSNIETLVTHLATVHLWSWR